VGISDFPIARASYDQRDDKERPAATTGDVSRPVATSSDSNYSLSIEDALARYEAAGIPRTRRSVQRYCANGALDSHRVDTSFGEKFLITAESVDRHIAYIHEVRPVATGHDLSRRVATSVAVENTDDNVSFEPARGDDKERPAATTDDVSRPVATNARVVELLESENKFLREQIVVKDKQIADQLERAHETNALVSGLQRLLAPLLSRPDRGDDTRA
jgi:hypothetical protein